MGAVLDLRSAARREPVELGPLPELDAISRELVHSTWRARMVNEHVSSRVFAALIPQLMKAGIDAERQGEVAEMITDELRHARRCAAVLTALGGEALAPLPDLAEVPVHADAPPLEALLRNVIDVCCLSETVAVSLIEGERRALGPSPIAKVLQGILADEVRHARFGWKLLEDTPLDEELRDRLGRYLRVAFRHLEAHELAHLSPLTPPLAAQSAGACDGREARAIFFGTVEQVIVPRLEQHGLAAGSAWERRAEPLSPQGHPR